MADSVKRERDEVDEELITSLHETPSDAQRARTMDEDEKSTGKRWTAEQDEALRQAVEEFGQRNWKSIAARVPGRNHAQCLQRWNKVLKPGLVKGHWSYEEDSILERMVLQGCHSWGEVSAHIPGRTAKQCRERWRNHLDPSINKAPFTPEEDMTIQQAYEQLGNRWTQIAELLPGRTEDAVKMRWKALNPNQKTNAKPGRPRLMPGMNTSKGRAPAQPSVDHMPATMMAPPPTHSAAMHHHPMYGYATTPYDTQVAMPMGSMPLGVMPPPPPQSHQYMDHQQPLHQHTQHQHQHHQHQHHTQQRASEMPEPIVEPLGEDGGDDVNSRDAAILKELLRSQSNSLLSFGSSRGMSSFADMSPEELLASGELDEMLKAVSLANEGNGGASFRSSKSSSFKLSSSFGGGRSLSKAMENMGDSEKHIFQELIDELRAGGVANPGGSALPGGSDTSDLPTDPNLYSFTSSSGRNLLHSLEFNDQPSSGAAAGRGGDHGDGEDDDDEIDDLLDSDLMRPIRKGKRY